MPTDTRPATKMPVVWALPPSAVTTFSEPGRSPDFAERLQRFIEMPLIKDYGDELLDGALAFSNAVRFALGLPAVTELKKGNKGNSESCVIVETILDGYDFRRGNVMVGGSTVVEGKTYKHPEKVSEFINAFDSGKYSALVN